MLAALAGVVAPAHAKDELEKLKQSTWDTKYKGDGIDGSVRAYLYLFGTKVKSRALDDCKQVILRGTLSDITYKKKGDSYVIRGDWEAGGESGSFKFTIDADDPSSFDGKWETDDGSKEGTWTDDNMPLPDIE